MSILARVLLALISSAVLATMVHQAVLAMKYPESLIALERRYRDSVGIKVYVALLAAGWGFAGYHAGAAFLGWVPASYWYDAEGEYFNVGAGLIALVSVLIPVAFWSLAEQCSISSRLDKERLTLDKLARLPAFTEADVDEAQRRFTKKTDPDSQGLSGLVTSVLQDRRSAIRFREAQAARVEADARLQAEEEQRRSEERQEREARTRAHAEADALYAAQAKDALREYREKVRTPAVATIDEIGETTSAFLIADSVIKDQWQALKEAAEATILLSDEDISRRHGAPYDASAILEAFKATRIAPEVRLSASYSGDGHGGSTTVFGLDNYGERRPWSEVLTFEMTLPGLVDAFYIAHSLPRLGVYWHGLYERDHSFVATDSGLVSFFADAVATADGKSWVREFNTPAGLRVRRIGADLEASCLAVSPTSGLTDKVVVLRAGKVIRAESSGLRRSNMQMLY